MQIKTLIRFVPWCIIIVLMVIISVNQCSKQSIKSDHEPELKQYIDAEKKRVIDLFNQGEDLKRKLIDLSQKDSLSVMSLKLENKALRKEVSRSRVSIQYVIDSVPGVKKFVALTDSLDIIQEAMADTLESQKAIQWKSFNRILEISDQKFEASNKMAEDFEAMNKSLSKNIRKERTKKTVWKITAGILATAIIFQSVKSN